jgi:hypothetical protein
MIFGERFCFVQNPKAASSAVTDALLPYCAPVPPSQLPDGRPSKHAIPVPGVHPYRDFRIGVVRNPFDRLVSAWCYVRDRAPNDPAAQAPTFRDFALDPAFAWRIGASPRRIDFQRTPQIAWLGCCNVVFRYETLGGEFPPWVERNLGGRPQLQHTNRSPRSGGYAAYYMGADGLPDWDLIKAVRERFHYDFEVWSYGY